MLCSSCQRQTICLAHRLSQTNPDLKTLLEQLKTCEMRIEAVGTIVPVPQFSH